MPIIEKTQGVQGQCTAVWEITETEQDLLSKVKLHVREKQALATFKFEQRRKEWLAVRALLRELRPDNPEIDYYENGRPYLKNNSEHISISHSGSRVAIALNTSSVPGVDIETIHPRIHKIATRFVNEAERAFLNETALTEQLCVLWACKEVLYKIHPEGMLSFKENLHVSPFVFTSDISLSGTITTNSKTTNHKLHCKQLGNYILVFTE